MASVAVTYDFSANTTAASAEVDQNFTDLVNYINNRNDGSATWDSLKATSATATVLTINNSTGTNSIAVFQDNGSAVVTIPDAGGITFAGTTPATPVANTLYKQNVVKAFGAFDGTGTPGYGTNGSFNMDSTITDNGTGDYSVSINTNFGSAVYASIISAAYTGTATITSIGTSGTKAAGSMRMYVFDSAGTALDSTEVNFILIGAQ